MRRTLLLLFWILTLPGAASAQVVNVQHADEKFHAAPEGTLLGTLAAGVALQLGAEQDGWREVALDGWIWAPSVRADRRQGFDLVVSARNGENLRAAPNGDILARFVNGTLLEQVAREGQWVQVRRTVWIRAAAIAEEGDTTATRPTVENVAAEGQSAAATATAPEGPPATTNTTARNTTTLAPGSTAWTGQTGTRLLNAPAGDTLASIRPLSAVEVLEHQGDWARIRLEGWVWAPALGTPADTGAVLTGLAPEVLLSNPEGFQGRILEWDVQFIALDRAEKIRTDFTEGELFILARPPGDQPGFVYVAISDEQRARVQELTPLQRITILARVRTGRSRQMAAPILELIELR